MPSLCQIPRESPRLMDMCHGVEKNLKIAVNNILFVVILYPENEFAAFFYLHLLKVNLIISCRWAPKKEKIETLLLIAHRYAYLDMPKFAKILVALKIAQNKRFNPNKAGLFFWL